uniref:uncharacterized protein LOC118520372 isoform X2 n=1 Tax=Halichoerus grypus TaxID=9711 RepID=UPI001658D73A|nr:uncharacterized protein LOC118520372 isoform X2 [Halichoerus grypus]
MTDICKFIDSLTHSFRFTAGRLHSSAEDQSSCQGTPVHVTFSFQDLCEKSISSPLCRWHLGGSGSFSDLIRPQVLNSGEFNAEHLRPKEWHKLENSEEEGAGSSQTKTQRRPLIWKRKCKWVCGGQPVRFSPGLAVAFADNGSHSTEREKSNMPLIPTAELPFAGTCHGRERSQLILTTTS